MKQHALAVLYFQLQSVVKGKLERAFVFVLASGTLFSPNLEALDRGHVEVYKGKFDSQFLKAFHSVPLFYVLYADGQSNVLGYPQLHPHFKAPIRFALPLFLNPFSAQQYLTKLESQTGKKAILKTQRMSVMLLAIYNSMAGPVADSNGQDFVILDQGISEVLGDLTKPADEIWAFYLANQKTNEPITEVVNGQKVAQIYLQWPLLNQVLMAKQSKLPKAVHVRKVPLVHFFRVALNWQKEKSISTVFRGFRLLGEEEMGKPFEIRRSDTDLVLGMKDPAKVSPLMFEVLPSLGMIKVSGNNKHKCVEFFEINSVQYCSVISLSRTPASGQTTEKISFQFDSPNWILGADFPSSNRREYVLRGDDIKSWSRLVTTETFSQNDGKLTAKQVVDMILSRFQSQGLKFKHQIVKGSQNDVTYEFAIIEPELHRQREIARCFFKDGNFYHLRYTTKAARFKKSERKKWLQILMEATAK